MDDEMFLELVQNMLPYQDEIMDVPTTDDNTSMDEDDGLFCFQRDKMKFGSEIPSMALSYTSKYFYKLTFWSQDKLKSQIFVHHTYLTLKFSCFWAEIENEILKYHDFVKEEK